MNLLPAFIVSLAIFHQVLSIYRPKSVELDFEDDYYDDYKNSDVELFPFKTFSRVYRFGRHVPDEILLENRYVSDLFFDSKNRISRITYPRRGLANPAYAVSFVSVNVTLNSAKMNVKILKGGVGKHFVHIFIKGYNTTYFTYDVKVFGRSLNSGHDQNEYFIN